VQNMLMPDDFKLEHGPRAVDRSGTRQNFEHQIY
jgi:hypothetical protein